MTMHFFRKPDSQPTRFGFRFPFMGPRFGGIGALFLVCLWVFCARAARSEVLFADLLPPDSFLVVSIPETGGEWRGYESVAVAESAARLLFSDAPELFSENWAGILIHEGLSSVELAVFPPPAGQAEAGALCVGRTRDARRVLDVMERLDEALMSRGALSGNPVSRSMESIGDAAVVIFADRHAALGYFLHGPSRTWGISNQPEALRNAARRAEQRGGGAEWVRAAEAKPAWARIEASERRSGAFDARFLLLPGESAAERRASGEIATPSLFAGETGRMFGRAQIQGATAGGIRFGPKTIRLEAFTIRGPGSPGPMMDLYRRRAGVAEIPGSGFFPGDLLYAVGGNLLDIAVLQEMARDFANEADAEEARNPLTPAQNAARIRLQPFLDRSADPEFLSEIGPEWFVALGDIVFSEPGSVPRLDLLLGVRTRNAERTQARMEAFEAVLPQAMPMRPAWLLHGDWLLLGLSAEQIGEALDRAAAGGTEAGLGAVAKRFGLERFHFAQVLRPSRSAEALHAILRQVIGPADPESEAMLAAIVEWLGGVDAIVFFREGSEAGLRTVGEMTVR